MSYSHLRIALLVIAGGLLAGTAIAQTKAAGQPPPPGEGGDAILPAGYKNVRWGINDNALQHVLDRGLESAPGMDHHRHWLIDTPPSNAVDSKRGVVKFHFWDSQLFEVTIFYSLTASEGKELLARFQEKYGVARHEVVKGKIIEYGAREASDAEERWQWRDPFTLQILRRELQGEKWSMIRQSRVLEELRLTQQRKEREEKRSNKIDDIELD